MSPVYAAAAALLTLLVGYLLGRHLGGSAGARQALRDEGICRAWDSLSSDLQECHRVHGLLAQPGVRVVGRWKAAFDLLLGAKTERIRPAALGAQLEQLGFSEEQAEWLVLWRRKRPGKLALVMMGLIAQVPDDELWAMAQLTPLSQQRYTADQPTRELP